MGIKLLTNKISGISKLYFYFGIFNTQDVQYVQASIGFFIKHKLHPKDGNFHAIFSLIKLYSKLKDKSSPKKGLKNKGQVNCENISFYKKVLSTYNIAIHEDILINCTNENNLTHILDIISYKSQAYIRKEADYLIFLISKAYLSSQLFERHYKKAKKSNKKIIFILNKDVDRTDMNFENVEICQPIASWFKLFNFRKFKRSMSSDDIFFFEKIYLPIEKNLQVTLKNIK